MVVNTGMQKYYSSVSTIGGAYSNPKESIIPMVRHALEINYRQDGFGQ